VDVPRWVVAMGGGGFSMEPDNPLLDDALLDLVRRQRGRERPRVCFLATASGDSAEYLAGFHAAFDAKAEASHLALFDRTIEDIDGYLRDQDLVYVGGGNTMNMLAVWRIHGVDRALRDAYAGGTVMAGLSAGSLCWFEGGTTDSFGPVLRPIHDGLGILAGSHCPHYDGEPGRRPLYQGLVGSGELAAGYAADDGAALVFRDEVLHAVVSSRPDARAYRVEAGLHGSAIEIALETRYLGDKPS
jgi:dipeptidase E